MREAKFVCAPPFIDIEPRLGLHPIRLLAGAESFIRMAPYKQADRYTTLAQESDDSQEREHYTRLRDAWITLAKRCEPFIIPDVTDSEN